MTDAIKLAIEALQNTIDCLMRENEKNDGPICDTIWYDDHTTLFDYINCELAALRAQLNIGNPITAQPDHSELVKRLRDFDFGASDVDEWIEIMDEAANALEGKAIEGIAMTDKELLEKAARAAGHEVTEDRGGGLPWTIRKEDGKLYAWNPLTDDGDALRLAVKLRIKIVQYPRISEAHIPFGERVCFEEPHDGDPYYAATRRAIVRAAAAIGETME